MKKILFATLLLCAAVTQGDMQPARAQELDYPVFDRLVLPDSILPHEYEPIPGRAWPKYEANPLVTIDSEVIEFISIWFMMSIRDENSTEEDIDRDESMERIKRFTTALSSYVRAAYLAMYLPPSGKGSDEIGVMALLLRPECTMLDGMKEGIFMEGMMFVNADTIVVYAFTDINSTELRQSMLEFFNQQLRE